MLFVCTHSMDGPVDIFCDDDDDGDAESAMVFVSELVFAGSSFPLFTEPFPELECSIEFVTGLPIDLCGSAIVSNFCC